MTRRRNPSRAPFADDVMQILSQWETIPFDERLPFTLRNLPLRIIHLAFAEPGDVKTDAALLYIASAITMPPGQPATAMTVAEMTERYEDLRGFLVFEELRRLGLLDVKYPGTLGETLQYQFKAPSGGAAAVKAAFQRLTPKARETALHLLKARP